MFLALLGCVHHYQPISGLHGPLVIDTTVQNFPELRLEVVCNTGDLNRTEARNLCRHVETLFSTQGAVVTTRIGGDLPDAFTAESNEADEEVERVDLRMELTSRDVHSSNDPITWGLFLVSVGLVPGVTDSSFALDVVVSDGAGFLLASDTLEGRIVRRTSWGVYLLNRSMDRWVRDDEDTLGDDAAYKDLSNDLYGQLSQLVFNAEMQWRVLQEAPQVEP